MTKLKLLSFCCCCMFAICSTNCDDPDPNNAFILSEEEIDWLESAGMKMYKGSSPPTIEGSYYLNSLTITHDDLGLDHYVHEYTYTFNKQNGENLSLSYSSPKAGDSAVNLPVYIFGNSNCFSVVANIEATSSGCDYNMSQIISGCLSDKGITSWQLGVVMGKKSGTNCDQMLEENHRRVIRENDGLAERVANN